MLLSHKHKFIYLKTRKTASSSTEISLSRYCDGPDDVVTPMGPDEEAIRRPLGVEPKNYLEDRRNYGWYDVYKLVVRGREKQRFWGHMTAADARERIEPHVWNSYFKFTFDRNPWDKTVSNYFWRCTRDRKPMTLEQYFERYQGRFPQYNFQYYSIDGKVAVDYVGRFEELTDGMAHALAQVGIEFDGWLPKAKSHTRKDKRHYSELFDERQQQIIADHFRSEIELLGYEYEDRRAAA